MEKLNGVRITSDEEAAGSKISLSGRIDIDSSPDLRTALLQRLRLPDSRSLTVDLGGVDYVDTSGLAVLLETLKAARAQGKPLHLYRLREQPRYLLEATRLLHLFDELFDEVNVP